MNTITKPIGVPYAKAIFSADGRYGVRCPECGYEFYARKSARTEDQATKEPGLEYAIHYERTHE